MKHGRRPTRSQCVLMQKWKLKPEDWLVVKDTPEIMQIVHRYSDRTQRIIHKEK